MKRTFGQKLTYALQDTFDSLSGRREGLMPPRSLLDDGSEIPGDFQSRSQAYLKLFQELGDLQPAHRVLDVGCGAGRAAIPLTEFLDEQGRYFGFDVNPAAIRWCEKHITARFPHFQFRHDKLIHTLYNPRGKYRIVDHYFAYEPKDFHFVALMDLFPFLLPDEVARYIEETARVLKKRAQAMISLYLLTDESLAALEAGTTQAKFPYVYGRHRTCDEALPEHGLVYEEQFVLDLLAEQKLDIVSVHYGTWSGRANGPHFQDVLVVKKP